MRRKVLQMIGLASLALLLTITTVLGDEGTNEVRVRIGQPGISAGRACDLFWAETTALEMVHTYEMTAMGWTQLGVDWDAFQAHVLPELGRLLTERVDLFAEMARTILAGEQLLAAAGVLDDWIAKANQITPWPTFPPELRWPWPWPNCLWYTHALQAGGAVDRAVEAMAESGSFQQMIIQDPLSLAGILSGAILETASLITNEGYARTMDQIAHQVAPIVLARVGENTTLRERWSHMLDDWGEDARDPTVALAMAGFQDGMEERGQEIRDWMDYVQAAAAVIGAAAAVAGLCM